MHVDNKTVFYFGYGGNSLREMMVAITGNENLVGYPATLKGSVLCVQRMDQVPDSVFPTSPVAISPRQLLQQSWPSSFESYTIKPASEDSEVTGTIWELTPEEREFVRDWELIDLGWYQDLKAKAITEDGQEIDVMTEGLRVGQEVDREVDGKEYEPLLNPLEDFQKVAVKARQEYLARIQ